MEVKKILTDSAVSLIRHIVVVLQGIIIIPIITKALGADSYGNWTVILSLVGVFSAIGGVHLHGALIRYSAGKDSNDQIFMDVLSLSVLFAALVAIAVPVTIPVLEVPILRTEAVFGIDVAVLCGVLAAIRIVLILLRNAPRAQNKVKTCEIIFTGELLFRSTIVVAVFVVVQDLTAGLVALLLADLVVVICLSVYFVPSILSTPDVSEFGRYLRYSLPMVPKEVSNRLLTTTDKVLILYFLGPAAVGIYAVSYGVASTFPKLTSIMNSTLYPSVSSAWENDERHRIQQFYRTLLRGYFIVVIPAVFGITILGWPLLRLLSTQHIADKGWLLVPVVSAGFVFRGIENVFMYVLNAAEETVKLSIGTTAAFAVNAVLNVLLLPIFGLTGAAIAILLAMIVRATYVFWHIQHHISVPVPTATIANSLLAATLMSAVLVWGIPFSLSWQVKLLLYPPLGVVVYSVSLFASGEIERRDLETAKSIYR